jgi:murein DD-endopeptidase MepM/ murein hydrolase activator NlpD
MQKRIGIFLLIAALLLFTTACSLTETRAQPDDSDPVITPPQEEPIENPGTSDPDTSSGGSGEPPAFTIDFRTSTPDELVEALSYLNSPIEGRTVSTVNGQLPNAPRRYRNGFHEGLDYYGTIGYTVLAAAPGTVIRADHGYIEMTLEEYEEVLRLSAEASITPPDLLDKLRGRQVWILHDDGVVTRYAHLADINPEIDEGTEVAGGQAIATVGNSGMRANITGKINSASDEPHLHFEIWYEDTFLGQGRPVEEVRSIFKRILDQ